MDFANEIMNRFVKKQADLINELIGLKLQTEAAFEVSKEANEQLQSELHQQIDGLKLELEMVKKQNNSLTDENASLKLARDDLQKSNQLLNGTINEMNVQIASLKESEKRNVVAINEKKNK